MQVLEEQNVYESDFAATQERQAPGWLRELRDAGMRNFLTLGFPTLKHEEWRFTDVRPIAAAKFPLSTASGDLPTRADIDALGFGGVSAVRLVFLDGRYVATLSRLAALPTGVRICALSQAIAQNEPALRKHLGRLARPHDDAFDALNTAFVEEGAFIHVARDAALEAPIHLLFVSSGCDPAATYPRNLIVLETGARATVVENYVTLREGSIYFSNSVTEAHVADHAELQHYVLERESERAFNVSTLRVKQGARSRFESHTALLGGALVRNNVHVELTGEKAHSLINGLYLPHGSQHHDNHMRVVHAAESCDSRQFYKGVLNDRASAVFTGRIVVTPQGQKTDAKQTNRNLLLSPHATINAKPQLEIYADDVKCTHGATTGQLDANAMHYLRSRGIDEETARGLLVHAFAHESLERMTVAAIRSTLERLMIARLPQSKLPREMGAMPNA